MGGIDGIERWTIQDPMQPLPQFGFCGKFDSMLSQIALQIDFKVSIEWDDG